MSAGQAMETQIRVIHALALRETRTRFGAHQLGYLWAIVEPVLWVLTFFLLFTVAGRGTPSGMNIVTFITTGIIPYQLVTKTLATCSKAIRSNLALLFYPQIHPIDLILSRTLLEFVTSTLVLLVVMCGNALIVGEFPIYDPLSVLFGLVLATLLGSTLGLVLAVASVISNVVDRLTGPLMRPLFWISGLFFTANALPSNVREVFLWNPILHTVEMVRGGFFREYDPGYADPVYVIFWIIGAGFVGLTLERMVRHRIYSA